MSRSAPAIIELAALTLVAACAQPAADTSPAPADPCGNGALDAGEECDGAGPIACTTLDAQRFLSGDATCQACRLDTAACALRPATAEFAPCTPGAASCEPGTACEPIRWNAQSTVSYCLRPCDPAGAATCGAGFACLQHGAASTAGVCVGAVAAGGSCAASDPQAICATGHTCLADTSGSGICRLRCSGNPSLCTDGTVCSNIFGPPFCLPIAAPNERCGYNQHACAEPYSCQLTSFADGPSFSCKRSCPPSELNTPSSCDAGEQCLYGSIMLDGDLWQPALEYQQPITSCTMVGEVDGCDAAGGYGCYDLVPSPACARRAAWCAATATMAGHAELAAFWDAGGSGNVPASMQCIVEGGSQLCGVVSPSGGTPADGVCLGVGLPDAGGGSICVGHCEGGRDCGSGYACVVANDQEYEFWEPVLDGGGSRLDCAGEPSVCQTPAQCITYRGQTYCATPSEWCRPE